MASLAGVRPFLWRQKVAAHVSFSAAELDELPIGVGSEQAMIRLRALLDEEMAVPLGPVEIRASSTHSVPGDKVSFVAQVDAFLLRHPNPLPPIDLFPRPVRAVRRWWNRTLWHRHIGPLNVQFSPSSTNLPRLRAGWASDTEAWASVEWGNGNSDPVWAIGLDFRPGPLASRIVDWFERR